MNGWRFALGLALTATAGAVDAISFLRFGAIYASFMSGNTVQIGWHAASADLAALATFGPSVACFLLGGFGGSLLVAKAGRGALPAVLWTEAACAALALGLDLRHGTAAATAALAFAMGAQNTLVVLVRGANPGTTFVTGTVFRFSDALAQRLLGRDPAGAWRLHLVIWLSFGGGAALGAVASRALGAAALIPVAGTLLALAVIATASIIRGRRVEEG